MQTRSIIMTIAVFLMFAGSTAVSADLLDTLKRLKEMAKQLETTAPETAPEPVPDPLPVSSAMDHLASTGELDPNANAQHLNDAPLSLSDLRFDQSFAMGLERGQGGRLVFANETAVANQVGGQDRSETARHFFLFVRREKTRDMVLY